jgi:hypothetical protein
VANGVASAPRVFARRAGLRQRPETVSPGVSETEESLPMEKTADNYKSVEASIMSETWSKREGSI